MLFIRRITVAFGIDLKKAFLGLRGSASVIMNAFKYMASTEDDPRFPLKFRDIYPCPSDRFQNAGIAEGHYFYQDLWAARLIYKRKTLDHHDVGSRIDGFIAHLLTFCSVTVIDIRPLDVSVSGLTFINGDIVEMPQADGTVESLSCLHALEHVGLGRYGDSVDPDGWRKAIVELQRILAPGGRLYLGVPIGRERLCFDAHRVFDPDTILKAVEQLDMVSFSYVDDFGLFREDMDPLSLPGMEYGCGLFEFTKVRDHV